MQALAVDCAADKEVGVDILGEDAMADGLRVGDIEDKAFRNRNNPPFPPPPRGVASSMEVVLLVDILPGLGEAYCLSSVGLRRLQTVLEPAY